jgi:uncharacterized protein YuzE
MNKNLQLAFVAFIILLFSPIILWAGDGDILWKTNFGGARNDNFTAVTEVFDGFVAVGYSDFNSFGTGDWEEVTGKGDVDAIIVKYDHNDSIVWKRNFGGLGADVFEAVIAVSDGIVVVGYSEFTSFGNGDWEEFERKGLQDAIVVKYDNDGNIMWKQTLGGKENGYSRFFSVIAIADEIIAVGYANGFGAGDWEEFTGNGSDDAIIVKYDSEGNVVGKTNFGGSDIDRFFAVTAAMEAIVAVGVSYEGSFTNGDWETDTCNGNQDAIMVAFDYEGNVVWKTNFGGKGDDIYYSVAAVADGWVAVGYSSPNSFGTGDWETDTCKGWEDAIIVKYDMDGNVVWKKSFGGDGWDCFYGVTAVANGVVAVGSSDAMGTGDWDKMTGKGNKDAIIVMFDNVGMVQWKKNFGGAGDDCYNSVTTMLNAVAVAGFSDFSSFTTGDWKDMEGKGWEDAILVKYKANTVSIFEPHQTLTNIKVYPNPTTGELRITNYALNQVQGRITNAEIFDITGRKISSYHLIPSSSHHLINISHLPADIYFMKVNNQTVKVVKQ